MSVTSWTDQAVHTNTITKSYRGRFKPYSNKLLKPSILMHKSKCSDCVSTSWYIEVLKVEWKDEDSVTYRKGNSEFGFPRPQGVSSKAFWTVLEDLCQKILCSVH